MTRENALFELEKPSCSKDDINKDSIYIQKKLELSEKDFQEIMEAPPLTYKDYPNYSLQIIQYKKTIKKITQNNESRP